MAIIQTVDYMNNEYNWLILVGNTRGRSQRLNLLSKRLSIYWIIESDSQSPIQ